LWFDVTVSPRGSPVNEERREQSKSRILEAAHDLFVEKGYDATTMAEVSRRAGVSAGLTLYYFRTKQHLVQALADRLLHQRLLRSVEAAPPRPDEQLAAFIDAMLQTDTEEPQIIAMHLALLLQPGVAELLADAENYWEEQLVRALWGTHAARGDPREGMLNFRATCMGASYSVVNPYMPISPVLARKRLFAEYGLDWNLGSPPSAAPGRGRTARRKRA
jgi:AcrR family transcriptional regulator